MSIPTPAPTAALPRSAPVQHAAGPRRGQAGPWSAPAVWKTRTIRWRLTAPASRRVSHTALDSPERRPYAPQARSLYSSKTTSRVGLEHPLRSRWEETDRGNVVVLRRAVHVRRIPCSPSPDLAFNFTGMRNTGVPLSQQAATARNATEPAGSRASSAPERAASSPELIPAPWATPTARDYRSGKASQKTLAKNARPLNEQAATSVWPTPTASDADGGPSLTPRDHGPRLRDHAASATKPWGTPRVSTNKGRGSARRAKGANSRIEDQAAAAVKRPRSNPTAETPEEPKTVGTLNPELSRWLQGYPVLWSECAPSKKPPKAAPDGAGEIEVIEPDQGATPHQWPDPLTGEFWQNTELVWCTYDEHPRRVERGTFPTATNIAKRAEKLRGYGNSVVPQVAAAFILATTDPDELEPGDGQGTGRPDQENQ